MRSKLCFGLLLVLSIIFGLSLSVSSDVNAANVVSSTPYNISSITFRDATLNQNPVLNLVGNTSSTWQLYTISPTYGYGVFSNLKINFPDNVPFHVGDRFKLDFHIFTYGSSLGNNTAFPFCFEAMDSFVLDSCSIEQVNETPYANSIVYRQGTGDPGTYDVTNSKYAHFIMHLDGHYSGDSDLSRNYIQFRGRFFYSDYTGTSSNFLYNFDFSVFSRYTIEQSAEDEMNQKDNEDRNNIESQSSDTDASAESSSEDAESTGTTLLAAFSSFVNNLVNAQPTNCIINGRLIPHLNLGNIDLCQLSLPQPLPSIASIMLILFFVPLSISTARKVINLFRSFQ